MRRAPESSSSPEQKDPGKPSESEALHGASIITAIALKENSDPLVVNLHYENS